MRRSTIATILVSSFSIFTMLALLFAEPAPKPVAPVHLGNIITLKPGPTTSSSGTIIASAPAGMLISFVSGGCMSAGAGTFAVDIFFFDESGTAEDLMSGSENCATLGGGSVLIGNARQFRVKAGTAITYTVSVTGSPDYNLNILLNQLTNL